MRTVAELREALNPETIRRWGAVSRVVISYTAKALWQVTGARLLDTVRPTRDIEPFTGIGFFARPASGGKPEAIVINVGDAQAPVIIAVRDEATRQKVAGGLKEDETAAFNSQCIVYIKADGTIEARTASGVAVPLALKTDVEHVDAKYEGHIHNDSTSAATKGPVKAGTIAPSGGSPPFLDGTPLDAAVIEGTTVLKGE